MLVLLYVFVFLNQIKFLLFYTLNFFKEFRKKDSLFNADESLKKEMSTFTFIALKMYRKHPKPKISTKPWFLCTDTPQY